MQLYTPLVFFSVSINRQQSDATVGVAVQAWARG
jgi:hypothetical protein